MNSRSLKVALASVLALCAAVAPFTSNVAEGKTKVVFFFDTEDFIQPRSADAIRDIANILRDEGVRGQFAMIGYLGKKLVDWRRFDVLDALKHHLIGTQTLYHSIHPNITESTDIEDYAKAREHAMNEECRAIGMLEAATGAEKMWCSVLPGNGNTIVALYLYADLGIPFFGGGTGVYEDVTKCGDIWYCNQRHLNYAYNLPLECFIPNYIGMRDVDKELAVLAKQKVATLYMHPHMAVCRRHWDFCMKGGNNHEFGKWPYAEARDPQDTEISYRRFRELVQRLKSDPRFEVTDCERLYAEQRPRRGICKADGPAIRSALRKSFGPIRTPGEWSIADAYQAAVSFLRGEESFMPGKAYGFLFEPKGVASRTKVRVADLRQAAGRLDLAAFVPPEIPVGGTMIGPADFLFAALEAIETGADEITVEPRDQLGEIATYLPKLAACKSFAGTWLYTPEFKDEWITRRLKWQFWTFRYE